MPATEAIGIKVFGSAVREHRMKILYDFTYYKHENNRVAANKRKIFMQDTVANTFVSILPNNVNLESMQLLEQKDHSFDILEPYEYKHEYIPQSIIGKEGLECSIYTDNKSFSEAYKSLPIGQRWQQVKLGELFNDNFDINRHFNLSPYKTLRIKQLRSDTLDFYIIDIPVDRVGKLETTVQEILRSLEDIQRQLKNIPKK